MSVGILVAVLTWLAIDVQVRRQAEALRNLGSAELPTIWLLVISAIATAVLAWSSRSMLTAGVVFLAGIALGMATTGAEPLLPIEWGQTGFAGFVIIRGAYEPAVLVLAAAWLVIGSVQWLAERRRTPTSIS